MDEPQQIDPAMQGKELKLDRKTKIIAAAMALMQNEALGVHLSGIPPAVFVQSTRPIFKRNGWLFSEEECAAIQYQLRRYTAFMAANGRLPVISSNGGNPMLLGADLPKRNRG